eukprot:11185180-Lingulodinium_polyedra.AAC.1
MAANTTQTQICWYWARRATEPPALQRCSHAIRPHARARLNQMVARATQTSLAQAIADINRAGARPTHPIVAR